MTWRALRSNDRIVAPFTRNQLLTAGLAGDITAVKSVFEHSQTPRSEFPRSGWAHRWAYGRALHSTTPSSIRPWPDVAGSR
jgi:hypothetical protein